MEADGVRAFVLIAAPTAELDGKEFTSPATAGRAITGWTPTSKSNPFWRPEGQGKPDRKAAAEPRAEAAPKAAKAPKPKASGKSKASKKKAKKGSAPPEPATAADNLPAATVGVLAEADVALPGTVSEYVADVAKAFDEAQAEVLADPSETPADEADEPEPERAIFALHSDQSAAAEGEQVWYCPLCNAAFATEEPEPAQCPAGHEAALPDTWGEELRAKHGATAQ